MFGRVCTIRLYGTVGVHCTCWAGPKCEGGFGLRPSRRQWPNCVGCGSLYLYVWSTVWAPFGFMSAVQFWSNTAQKTENDRYVILHGTMYVTWVQVYCKWTRYKTYGDQVGEHLCHYTYLTYTKCM